MGRYADLGVALYMQSCFAARTPILTPDGFKFIEDLKVGDLVLSRSEFDPEGPVEAKVVEEVFVNFAPLVAVHVGGRIINTTAPHAFFVRAKGWTRVADLQLNDLLCGSNERNQLVEQIIYQDEMATVYNLRIREFHTYFVGEPDWLFSVWVHNSYTRFLEAIRDDD